MAKTKKTLDDASLRAMANLATASSDLSKLQENFGWNIGETANQEAEQQPEKPAADITTQAEQSAQLPEELTQDEPANFVTETPNKAVKEPASAATTKKVDKYTNTYLQPIKGFERPTKVAYISKRAHSYIALLQRYADLTGSKVSMQEIMENIFREHITDHKTEIESIRTTVQQKEAELHE